MDLRKELKKSFYEPPIMLEENPTNDKKINLSSYNGNNGNNGAHGNSEFRVIKGGSPVGSAERPSSLILDSVNCSDTLCSNPER